MSGSFPMNWLFASGGQSTGASASASVFPMNIQSWFHLGVTNLISLQSKDSKESSSAPQFESINSLALNLLYPTLTYIHDYWKNHSFDYMNLCQQSDISVMLSLMCCLGFLPKSKGLVISWQPSSLQSTVILESKKIVCHCFHFPPFYLP